MDDATANESTDILGTARSVVTLLLDFLARLQRLPLTLQTPPLRILPTGTLNQVTLNQDLSVDEFMNMNKKKFSPFDECSCVVCLRRQYMQKQIPSVCLSVWLSGVRTWILAVDTITFEGVSGFKQNLVSMYEIYI